LRVGPRGKWLGQLQPQQKIAENQNLRYAYLMTDLVFPHTMVIACGPQNPDVEILRNEIDANPLKEDVSAK
jgi:hypothetical protein